VNEGREESEDREDVDLRNDEELGWVHVVPVAEFMSWGNVRADENGTGKTIPYQGRLPLLQPCSV
jgi:hypothetical protein